MLSEMARKPPRAAPPRLRMRNNARMDSATLLGIVGVAGTLVGAAIGAGSALGTALISNRGQASTEDQKSRRQAYGACATALLTRKDAAAALMDSLFEGDYDLGEARTQLQDLLNQRAAVMLTVGAVAVEGPQPVAWSAETAAEAIDLWAGRLRSWLAAADREHTINDQRPYGREDGDQVQVGIENFNAACRKILHPHEHRHPRRWNPVQRWRRRVHNIRVP